MKYSVNVNSAIAAAVAVLNNAGNWYKVTVENADTGRKEEFCATGINVYHDSFIKFSRQFAKPRYIVNWITDVHAAAENIISFQTEKGDVWTVKAYHNDTLADVDKATGNAKKLETLVDWTRTRPTDNGGLFVVLDLRKLGRLTVKQEAVVEKYMNVNLHGLRRSRQKCRTICFETEYNTELEEQEIYIGLYDLESEETMTRLLFDADCFDCVYSKKDKAARNKVRRLMVYVAAELAKGEEVPF